MHEPATATRMVEIAALGERLSALRLCDAEALTTIRRSLEQHGQLAALTLFAEPGGLEIIDGFKRVRAARALGWATLVARIDDVGAVDAKLRLRELHDRRGLTELEEAWVVRSLYREDRVPQPEIARRMNRHKSWVWRRLMLVEALDPLVQTDVRLGLIAPRAAVAVSRLPRGNQTAASAVVVRLGVKVGVLFGGETAWLTQKALAELFGVGVPAITKHLKNIFESGELSEASVVSILETTAADGKSYKTRFYNLDAIFAVCCSSATSRYQSASAAALSSPSQRSRIPDPDPDSRSRYPPPESLSLLPTAPTLMLR